MGGWVESAKDKAKEAEEKAKRAADKIKREAGRVVDNIKEDPVDQLIDYSVHGTSFFKPGGLVGTASIMAIDKEKDELQAALKPPGLGDIDLSSLTEDIGSKEVSAPTEANVGAEFAADTELQDKVRKNKKRRSRASNILTSSRGLAPIEEGNLARRTLLAS